ncbi:hypothetical protein ZIOFF_000342 [Zingiber officinale]|uniref:Uncharacterized protein n=1 Tax=Zingiber officinale TaxID=94328 RepID=A0A8J5HTJ9_ZINOF|nr:hypothetical protein ZIOFF_000342 [Zingiber officinale]
MDPIILESPAPVESLACGPLTVTNFQTMLEESIERFLIEVTKESYDFSAFRPIFFRLIQSSVDPPLEVIWFYSALGYHEAIRSKRDVFDRIFAVRDLLQLLSACSASCNGPKSVALLAPVVSELYYFVREEKKLSGKVAKKLRKEIDSLAEAVISYVSICSGRSSNGQELSDGYLLPCFMDIVRVWTLQHCEKGDDLNVLFPCLSDEICAFFKQEKCGIGYLAGAVAAETFFLNLALKVQVDGLPRPDLQKELTIWSVSSISVFQNCVFFVYDAVSFIYTTETATEAATASYYHLVFFPQSSKDESLIRNVLYDSVILVDYSFINPGFKVENFNDSLMNLIMRRLIVTHEAIRSVRGKRDYNKAISYTNAFTTSCVPNALVKWATHQIRLDEHNRPSANTPQGLLKWFVVLEERGLKLFEDDILELCNKVMFEESHDDDATKFNSGTNTADDDLFFFDNKGRVENEAMKDDDMGTAEVAFLTAAHSMKTDVSKKRRKQREHANEESGSQLKFLKYNIDDDSVKDYFNSGSEVENPPSADEMEE